MQACEELPAGNAALKARVAEVEAENAALKAQLAAARAAHRRARGQARDELAQLVEAALYAVILGGVHPTCPGAPMVRWPLPEPYFGSCGALAIGEDGLLVNRGARM